MTVTKPQYLVFIILLFLFQYAAHAFSVPEEVKVVTAPVVKRMVNEQGILLVDSLSEIEYSMQHIPNSINIPSPSVPTSSKMPSDKNTPIIFYCKGPACPYSARAANLAHKMGYTQLHWFRGGIAEWRKFGYEMFVNNDLNSVKVKRLSPKKLNKIIELIDKSQTLIVDVRPQFFKKFKGQYIPGTNMLLPLVDLVSKINELPKDKKLIIADPMMKQAIPAAKYLKLKGYDVIGVLKGGIKRWIDEGLPVQSKID